MTVTERTQEQGGRDVIFTRCTARVFLSIILFKPKHSRATEAAQKSSELKSGNVGSDMGSSTRFELLK